MTQRKQTPKSTAEFRAGGVRLFKENRADYASDNAAYITIAPKLGCSPDSLRAWCRQADRDAGERSGLCSDEKARIKDLETTDIDANTETYLGAFDPILEKTFG